MASTLLRNLFFLSLAALLTACTNHGGGYGGFKLLDTGSAGDYTCDSVKDGLRNSELGQGCAVELNRFEILTVGVREDSGVSGVRSEWGSGGPPV